MKKILAVAIGVFLSAGFLFSPTSTQGHLIANAAQGIEEDDPLGVEYGEETGLSKSDPRIIIGRIIQVGLGLLGVVALILFLYGGFLILTSAGNEEKVTKGKNVITWAIVGLGIILAAYSITTFVIESLYTATSGNIYR